MNNLNFDAYKRKVNRNSSTSPIITEKTNNNFSRGCKNSINKKKIKSINKKNEANKFKNTKKSRTIKRKTKVLATLIICLFFAFIINRDDIGAYFTDIASSTNVFSINAEYTISFNRNTGSGTMGNQTISYNVPTNLNLNTFTKTGYGFAGWNTKEDGTGIGYSNGEEITNLGNKTLYAQWEKLPTRYAVQIYGINQDEDENGNPIGLTFGPATRVNYNNKYVTHGYEETSIGSGVYYVKIITHTVASDFSETITEEYLTNSEGMNVTRTTEEKNKYDMNLHNMTWEQIANITDKTVFLDCMLCGDTKRVELTLNSTIGTGNVYNQRGDGTGKLFGAINEYYRKWNPKSSDNSYVGTGITFSNSEQTNGSNARDAGAYSSSHLRATLIGENEKTNKSYAGDINLDSYNCLYSCIESDLRDIITAKKVRYVTGTSYSSMNYQSNNDIVDKIWIPSTREMYGGADDKEGIGPNGDGYDKFGNSDSKDYISSYNSSNSPQRVAYSEGGSADSWWSRTPDLIGPHVANIISGGGSMYHAVICAADGLGFGFCLQGNYEVTFNANNGTGVMQNQIISNNVPTKLVKNTFTKENCTFVGWNTEPDGSGMSYTDEDIVTNLGSLTLYCQWKTAAYFNGDNSISYLSNVVTLENITRFEKYTGSNSTVQTLINNGTAVKIDDNTTNKRIYAWFDNGTINWWTDAEVACMLDKSHYLLAGLHKAEYIDVTGINTSKVTNMEYMFSEAGRYTLSSIIGDISGWDVSNVIDMSSMFSGFGYYATTISIGDLSGWNVSNVTEMDSMLSRIGLDATTFYIGNLSEWDVSSVTTMENMFSSSGEDSTTWYIGDLSDWDVSNVTNMSHMFSHAGGDDSTWNIGDLSDWDVSSVENMSYMFYLAGRFATIWSIGNLSNWDTSNVTDMSYMFNIEYDVVTNSPIDTWNSIGTLKIYATNIEGIFNNCSQANATLNIYTNPTTYTNAFYNAATESDSGIVVNYANAVTNIDNIIATKSNDSNVTKGSLLP